MKLLSLKGEMKQKAAYIR